MALIRRFLRPVSRSSAYGAKPTETRRLLNLT